jgi:phage-related protein
MQWRVEVLDERVVVELEALSADLRAKFVRIAKLLESLGPQQVREPHVKPLGDKLWEMRMAGRDGIARAIYLAAHGQRLVVVHVFIKKTQKTPRAAIETARSRAKEAGLL